MTMSQYTTNYLEHMQMASEKLFDQGAFLTTKSGDCVNTMAIAWGSIGFMMSKPVFTVFIRKSRYTTDLLQRSQAFTVSIPSEEDMKQAIHYCGTHSGRNERKIENSGLHLIQEGLTLSTPLIDCSGYHYECKLVVCQPITAPLINASLHQEHYIEGNPYLCCIGEIITSYKR